MSEGSDDKGGQFLAWALLGVGAAGIALWKKLHIDIDHTPIEEMIDRLDDDQLHEAAAHIIERHPNPIADRDMWSRAQMLRQAGLRRRKLKAERDARGGGAETPAERALIDMAANRRFRNKEFNEALRRFQAIIEGERPSGHPRIHDEERTSAAAPGNRQPPPKTCLRCDGVGWFVCPGCGGTGVNAAMPGPHYTGDPLVDALTSARYDDTCPTCHGAGTTSCLDCHGTGRTP